jgi:hypothetical protein
LQAVLRDILLDKYMKRVLSALAVLAVFGALGGASAICAAADPRPAAVDLVLKGDAKCTACHDESDSPNVLHIGKTKHGTTADGRWPHADMHQLPRREFASPQWQFQCASQAGCGFQQEWPCER